MLSYCSESRPHSSGATFVRYAPRATALCTNQRPVPSPCFSLKGRFRFRCNGVVDRTCPSPRQPAMELSDAFAERGVQIPSPNPRWKRASRAGFEPRRMLLVVQSGGLRLVRQPDGLAGLLRRPVALGVQDLSV